MWGVCKASKVYPLTTLLWVNWGHKIANLYYTASNLWGRFVFVSKNIFLVLWGFLSIFYLKIKRQLINIHEVIEFYLTNENTFYLETAYPLQARSHSWNSQYGVGFALIFLRKIYPLF